MGKNNLTTGQYREMLEGAGRPLAGGHRYAQTSQRVCRTDFGETDAPCDQPPGTAAALRRAGGRVD